MDNSEPSVSLPPLREVIRLHNLRAEKSLGQNFLLDQNLTDKIVRLAGDLTGINIIEIGPGPGGLTRSLLASPARHVTAIEYDSRAVAAINDLKSVYGDKLNILNSDALQVDITQVTPEPRSIIANLPYNISVVLLMKWLEAIRSNPYTIHSMVLMFQKEVADRLLADVSNKSYGRVSVMTQWLCRVKRLFDLPPSAFTPPPKIKSSVILFQPHVLKGNAPSFASMEKIVAAAFNQRRKMIRSSLSDYSDALNTTNIDTSLRAEDLSVDDFVSIALAYEAL